MSTPSRPYLKLLSALLLLAGSGARPGFAEGEIEFFENRIRPVLVQHCYECHSSASDEVKGGLLLDHRAGWQRGGDSGTAVVPGKPEKSLLLAALRHESYEMPPKKKLDDAIIADFEEWIRRGAADPRDKPPSATDAAAAAWKAKLAERSRWWSLQRMSWSWRIT